VPNWLQLKKATDVINEVEVMLKQAEAFNAEDKFWLRRMMVHVQIVGRNAALEAQRRILGTLHSFGEVVAAIPIVNTIINNPVTQQLRKSMRVVLDKHTNELEHSIHQQYHIPSQQQGMGTTAQNGGTTIPM